MSNIGNNSIKIWAFKFNENHILHGSWFKANAPDDVYNATVWNIFGHTPYTVTFIFDFIHHYVSVALTYLLIISSIVSYVFLAWSQRLVRLRKRSSIFFRGWDSFAQKRPESVNLWKMLYLVFSRISLKWKLIKFKISVLRL